MTTIGYGDVVPQTWIGRIIASCFSIFAISFFALPAGILGSGFALKVQQKQRQKHFNRQIPAAATLIQCLWRCHAADDTFNSMATWKIHLAAAASTADAGTAANLPTSTNDPGEPRSRLERMGSLAANFSGFGSGLAKSSNHSMESSNIYQRARRASFFRRKKESHKHSKHSAQNPREPLLNSSQPGTSDAMRRKVSDVSLDVCSIDSKRRTARQRSDDSSVGDQTDQNYDGEDGYEPQPIRELREPHKNAIRAIRKIKYFVARRKFQQARKPYDVRDVIEQYSQGHLNMMVRIKELQRRLDQTLGKPGQYHSSKKSGHNMTVGSRLSRVEIQLSSMEQKLDSVVKAMHCLTDKLGTSREAGSSKAMFQSGIVSQPSRFHHSQTIDTSNSYKP